MQLTSYKAVVVFLACVQCMLIDLINENIKVNEKLCRIHSWKPSDQILFLLSFLIFDGQLKRLYFCNVMQYTLYNNSLKKSNLVVRVLLLEYRYTDDVTKCFHPV